MKKETQKSRILKRLQKGLPVNTVWAVQNNILRLSERIRELIRKGHDIETYYEVKNKKRVQYASYRIKKD